MLFECSLHAFIVCFIVLTGLQMKNWATKLGNALIVHELSHTYTVKSFIFLGLKFRGFQVSHKMVGI